MDKSKRLESIATTVNGSPRRYWPNQSGIYIIMFFCKYVWLLLFIKQVYLYQYYVHHDLPPLSACEV